MYTHFMATLTEISVMTRKGLLFIGGFFGFILLLYFLAVFGINAYKAAHPIKDLPPNHAFNKIPKPKFPENSQTSQGLIFRLETIEGRPPDATPSGKVYFMPKKLPSLLAPQKANEFARRMNFDGEPQVITSTKYKYSDSTNANRTLELDIVNLFFQLNYSVENNANLFLPDSLPQKENAPDDVRQYLQNVNAVNAELFSGIYTANYLAFDGKSEYNPVSNYASANAVRVDFFRRPISGLPLMTPSFKQSYNYAIITPNRNESRRYIKIYYTFWPIAFDSVATYPLISSQDAWTKVQNGEGYIASMGANQKTEEIVVRKIYLGYYDSGMGESYLQPIFVFEGDKDFAAYVPAIDPLWLE